MRLPSAQGFTLRLQSVSGSIHTASEMTVRDTPGKHEMEGKVGDGSFMLEVNTVSGNISVD